VGITIARGLAQPAGLFDPVPGFLSGQVTAVGISWCLVLTEAASCQVFLRQSSAILKETTQLDADGL
jgi:hypothetical protein